MRSTPHHPADPAGTRVNRHGRHMIRLALTMSGAQLAILLFSAGTWRWPNAWLYWSFALSTQLIGLTTLARKNPELLNERGKMFKPDTKGFDRVLLRVYLVSGLSALCVAGIDHGRIAWSAIPFGASVVALLVCVAGGIFSFWAVMTNPHFESTVRIQRDRGHRVISAGPYRFVRHPGYAGALLLLTCLPVILGSWLAYLPVGIAVVALLMRTSLEDRTLHRELEGYAEYARSTRRRLIPGVW